MKRSLQHILCLGVLALGAFFPAAGKKNHKHDHKGQTYVVTTTADTGKGSLRNAINCINTKKEDTASTIRFDIPCSDASVCNGAKCYVIQPGSATNGLPLPAIQYPVKIKGPNSDGGIIELNGKFANQTVTPEVGVPTGLALIGSQAGCSSIKNLVFSQFAVSIYLNNVENITIKCSTFSESVINQSSIVGTSISNLNTNRNTFTTTATDTNGIFLTNPTGTINVKNSTFSDLTAATSASNGNGVYVLLNNGGTLDALDVSGSTFSNISGSTQSGINGGNGVFVDFEGAGGTLNTFIVTGSTFYNVFNSGSGVKAYINASGSTIGTATVSDSTFSGITNSAAGVVAAGAGSITTANVTGSVFSDISNSGVGVRWAIASGSSLSILNNRFNTISDTSRGIYLPLSLAATAPALTVDVSGNTFTGPNAYVYDTGYAVFITVSSGSICLAFTGNNATPINNPTPYLFTQVNPGVFNISAESGNSGQIDTVGTIGTC